jgi:hypothetical protein
VPSNLVQMGCLHEISGLQALDRGRWPQNEREPRGCILERVEGDRSRAAYELSELVAEIDAQRQFGNLSSALRLFVLDFFRAELSHVKEGREGAYEVIGYTAPAFS